MNEYLLVLTTVSSEDEGKAIAQKIVEEQLAACVNVSSAIRSYYWWEERITDDREFILFIKTRTSLFRELEEKIKTLHSYEVPEIIALPIFAGSKDYLDWVRQSTKS
jgi:periplasmic divalent cation tolerance protein